jgi:hypothetical protein
MLEMKWKREKWRGGSTYIYTSLVALPTAHFYHAPLHRQLDRPPAQPPLSAYLSPPTTVCLRILLTDKIMFTET